MTETTDSSRFVFAESEIERKNLFCFKNGVYFRTQNQNANAKRFVFQFAKDVLHPMGTNGVTNLFNFWLICDLIYTDKDSESFRVVSFYPVRTRTNNNSAEFIIPNYTKWRINQTN